MNSLALRKCTPIAPSCGPLTQPRIGSYPLREALRTSRNDSVARRPFWTKAEPACDACCRASPCDANEETVANARTAPNMTKRTILIVRSSKVYFSKRPTLYLALRPSWMAVQYGQSRNLAELLNHGRNHQLPEPCRI